MDAYWAKLRSHKKRERASISQSLSYSALDLAIAFSLYLAAVLLCLFLRNIDQHQDTTYVAVIFFLDVFLTAYWTNGYLLGIITAVAGVFSVDYIFTYPYWHISFTLTGFPLTCRDALNAAPVDHGEIAGVVDDKGDAAGSHASVPEGVPRICAEPGAGTVENDDKLEDQRRTPDNPDDDVGQGRQGPELGEPAGKAPRFLLPVSQSPEGRPLAHGAEGYHQTKGQREQQRQEKQLDRLTTALQDREGNSPEHEKILLYVVIMGGTKGEEGKRMREICRSKAESDRSLPLLYDLRSYLVTMTWALLQ